MELENLVTRLAIAPLGTGNSLIDVPDVRRHLMVVPTEDEQPSSGWKTSREEARRAMILKTIAAAGAIAPRPRAGSALPRAPCNTTSPRPDCRVRRWPEADRAFIAEPRRAGLRTESLS